MSKKPLTFNLSWSINLPSGAKLYVEYKGSGPLEDAEKFEQHMEIMKSTILSIQQDESPGPSSTTSGDSDADTTT